MLVMGHVNIGKHWKTCIPQVLGSKPDLGRARKMYRVFTVLCYVVCSYMEL
jgi:hypothetical protein